jgi:hypothetical protein
VTNVMRISKAKLKDDQLYVELESTDEDTERKTSLRSLGGVHPDLDMAFLMLHPHVREILEWPDHLYDARLTITGVSWSFSETTGVEGATMVCQAEIDTCNSPFCFNTPHLPFSQYCEDGNAPIMPPDAVDALNALRAEVQAYLDGKRAQGDLFQRTEERYGIPADVAREHA